MKHLIISAAVIALSAPAAIADGHADPEAGKRKFGKCVACHVVKDDSGKNLAGRSGRTGPNLYQVVGRQAGSLEGFRFKKSIVVAGQAGLIWTEEEIAKYLMNPTQYMRDVLDSSSARSGMSFRLRDEQEALDVAAFLASFNAQ